VPDSRRPAKEQRQKLEQRLTAVRNHTDQAYPDKLQPIPSMRRKSTSAEQAEEKSNQVCGVKSV